MTTYALIPGAGCSSWYWHLVEAALRERGHDVLPIDLPCEDDAAGLDEYAETVAAAIGQRDGDVVVVAHSFGGFTAPLVCARVRVDLLVLTSAMIPRPGERPGDWWASTGHASEDGDVYYHDVDPELAAAVEATACGQSGTPLAAPWPLDAWPQVPTRFLLFADDRFFPAPFMRRVVRERLGIEPDEMPGGHLAMVSRPAELAERLEAYRLARPHSLLRMKAIWLHEFGGPEVLTVGDAPDPVAGPGQALIGVAHANITFVETQFRATGAGPFEPELPMIPGNGVGGVVAAVGAGVDPALAGTRVVSSTGGSGGYAERVAVDAAGLVAVPDGLALDAAVALLADGRTATLLVRAAAPQAGERVLVEAAAGGVGTLLVQLAKADDAYVVAAAGGPRKLGLARSLGADECVDYTAAGWTEGAGAVDVVFDGVGGDVGRAAFTLLREGGRMVSFGLASGSWAGIEEAEAAARGVTLRGLSRPAPDVLRAATESALAEAAAGRLRPVIGQRFPLAGAADAHAAMAARETVGKTLLDVS